MSESCVMMAAGAATARPLGGGDAVNDRLESMRTDAEIARDERRRRLIALVRQTIGLEYPSDKEFARAAGVTQQYLSALLKGKINVPSAENRRSLARALHMSHPELLMLMGELEPDEIGPEANDLRADDDIDTFALLRLYRRIDDQQRRLVIQTMANFVGDDERRAALS